MLSKTHKEMKPTLVLVEGLRSHHTFIQLVDWKM